MSFCKHRVMDRCKKYNRPCIFSPDCFEPEEEKHMTNADRIRNMSDEELNDMFHDIYNAGVDDAVSYEWGHRTNGFEWTMEWLQQPAE